MLPIQHRSLFKIQSLNYIDIRFVLFSKNGHHKVLLSIKIEKQFLSALLMNAIPFGKPLNANKTKEEYMKKYNQYILFLYILSSFSEKN